MHHALVENLMTTEPRSIKAAIIGCFIGSLIYKVAIEVATFGGSETVGSEYNNTIMAIVLIFLMALIHDTKGRGGRK
ncbi:MAG: hypothetical protein LBF54_04700 [Holosporaceae bacterium]|jgi:ABC-type uncharacterized transport system permease subunit|nr:hypothetical protein [Holosporaceae bacterium]